VKKISVLLLKSYIGPFIITFMVAMFIFEMQFIWVYLDELIGKGLSSWVIFKLLFFASARVVNMALPLAILMSSIMTMGALAENNEMTAMKSAGVSLMRIMRPLIVFSAGLSVLAFLFANNLWPVANLKCRTMLFSIMKQKPSLNLTDGVFYSGIEGISIRAAKNNNETGELNDVLIYDHRGGERVNRTVIRAANGLMEQTEDKRYLILTLFNGNSYDEQKEKAAKDNQYPLIKNTFEKMVIRLDLSSLAFDDDNDDVMKNAAEMMTFSQLDESIQKMTTELDSVKYSFRESNFKLISTRLNFASNDTMVPVAPSVLLNDLTNAERMKAITLARENTRKQFDMIQRQQDEMKGRNKVIIKHKIEWHRKFFLAVVCFVLFFIGAPLGAIIRKGGIGLPTLIALGLFIVYQLLTMIGERVAKNGFIEPWLGMWISTVVLLPMSLWITVRATKEAALLDRDMYVKLLNKLFVFLRLRAKPETI
jgi:lipopolysaccharide export system permease protein